MLNDLFVEVANRYRSFRLLGTILDDFDDWLVKQGYAFGTRRNYIKFCAQIEKYFQKRRVYALADISTEDFRKCLRYFERQPGQTIHGVVCFQRFLLERRLLPGETAGHQFAKFETVLKAYETHLIQVRGFSRSTVQDHCQTGFEFLRIASNNKSTFRLKNIERGHIEKFIDVVGSRVSRGTLQHAIAHVRSLLRFLTMRGDLRSGLDSQIDTPRTYRQEQLPKSVPWDIVCSFVEAIDRTSASGPRDYAMFLMMITYGLRGCDVAGLKLDDIDWKSGEIRFIQHKTKYPLVLPLVDQVGEALLAYLRHGRPQNMGYRQVFLTLHAPIRPVTTGVIREDFRRRIKCGKLLFPFEGLHCLRHSYATHLLRQGLPLKAIGDVLGHHSTESTCVYLRLNLEELRDVALPLPLPVSSKGGANL